ncbi:MAG TPA: bacillithiol biosynthesis cysteine-adding enzyme BshC, partial [Planctomycetota bacterium]|nr:bacillithiol biosynthesis cysteine-adding enzyme BshC [Planctomycetota bacterium]
MSETASKIQSGSVCRVSYETAGFGGKLMSDLARGAGDAGRLFPKRNWREVVAEIETRKYPRAELSQTIVSSLRALGAPDEAMLNATLLGSEKTYAIVTGQQAGFLGGPLYALYKALTAIKLAQQYNAEAAGAAKFVPVFWVAGDDHDLHEIDHAYFLKADGSLDRLNAEYTRDNEGRAASDVWLAKDDEALQRQSAALTPYLTQKDIEYFSAIYFKHSLERAFASVLLHWLGKAGLVVVCSCDLRQFGGELLARNLDDYERVGALIDAAGEEMARSGYEPGFEKSMRKGPHFFMEGPDCARMRIEPIEKAGARIFRRDGKGGDEFTREELLAQDMQKFSAAAALRPILQNLIFPCVATVLGPGEISYWAQLREVHAHYGAVWPLIVPRATLTLIDSRGEKAVRKLGLENEPEAIFGGIDVLRARAIVPSISAEANAKKDAALEKVDELLKDLQQSAAGVEPMLAKVRAKIAYQLERVIARTAALKDLRNGALAARAAYLHALVHPKGAPQERV